jgi:hypothetical protein
MEDIKDENKSVSVKFDKYSKEILKRVDPIHRESMINLGLALVSKTGYFQTLCGVVSEELTDIANIGDLGKLQDSTSSTNTTVESNSTPKVQPKPKQSATWDDF